MNKSEELAKLLGIEPKCKTMIICCPAEKNRDWNNPFDKSMCENCKEANSEYPDFIKPNNFVKLLEILAKSDLMPLFGFYKESYFCDIHFDYAWFDAQGDHQELLCLTGDTIQEALISTLYKVIYGCAFEENPDEIYLDTWRYDLRDHLEEIDKNIELIKQQAQQIEWEY